MRAIGLSVALISIAFACNVDSGDGSGGPRPPRSIGGPMCESLEAQMRACGAIGPGAFTCEEPATEWEHCMFGCMDQKPCTDLIELLCLGVNDNDPTQGPLAQCFVNCHAASFLCDSGEQVPTDTQCNGSPDCSDASDEHNCAPAPPDFECTSGDLVPADFRCDGMPQCDDGNSDEAACPERALPICN